jgi:hypothetical protein
MAGLFPDQQTQGQLLLEQLITFPAAAFNSNAWPAAAGKLMQGQLLHGQLMRRTIAPGY